MEADPAIPKLNAENYAQWRAALEDKLELHGLLDVISQAVPPYNTNEALPGPAKALIDHCIRAVELMAFLHAALGVEERRKLVNELQNMQYKEDGETAAFCTHVLQLRSTLHGFEKPFLTKHTGGKPLMELNLSLAKLLPVIQKFGAPRDNVGPTTEALRGEEKAVPAATHKRSASPSAEKRQQAPSGNMPKALPGCGVIFIASHLTPRGSADWHVIWLHSNVSSATTVEFRDTLLPLALYSSALLFQHSQGGQT
ncbi:hypothetical protein EJ06DRAFT_556523 [Trichodelitschia bisporula]|uniref:DUF4219 domain-containing protein n=1 Tax=Trichodelitschia bisporula TaxID=703511 RepID=A0A6G1HWQ0_9PEZI|nr:hypothetical protein EJ06DRAFT_556523 [Trichodelitschia bisporula]